VWPGAQAARLRRLEDQAAADVAQLKQVLTFSK
jgi:hypothetical protein